MEEDEKSWTEERRDWRRKKKESVSFRWAIPNRKEVSAKGGFEETRRNKGGTCGKRGKVREGRDKE